MRAKISPFTWIGRGFGVSNSITANLWRELAVWLMAALLIALVRFGESLPLSSIRLGTAPWKQSLEHGAVLTGLCGVTAYIIILFTGYGHGPGSAASHHEPIWFATLTVIRAGIVEELFFRGYAIERLEAIGCGRILSAAMPLAIFANTLDGRNSERHHRFSGGNGADSILSVAAGLGCEHDMSRPERLSRVGVAAFLPLTHHPIRY